MIRTRTVDPSIASPVIAATAVMAFVLLSCCDTGPGGEIDRLLARANQYMVNGFVDEAEKLLDQVLDRDGQNAEARLQKMFCALERGAVNVEALADAVDATDAGELPPGYGDLARARLLLRGNDRKGARRYFERAAARGMARIRQAVLHEVDFLREWSATRIFSVAARFPIIEEKGRALSRLTFRPLEAARLTAFVCTPRGNARLVYPRACGKALIRPGDDESCPAGEARLVEFFRDSGEWIVLSGGDESFLCALATEGKPDREQVRSLLLGVLEGGGGGPECVAALEEKFGEGRALTVTPAPF